MFEYRVWYRFATYKAKKIDCLHVRKKEPICQGS